VKIKKFLFETPKYSQPQENGNNILTEEGTPVTIDTILPEGV